MTQSKGDNLQGVPRHKRREALRRNRILVEWHSWEEQHDGGRRGDRMREFVTRYNTRHARPVSVKQIETWELRCRRGGGVAGLVDGRGRSLSGARFLGTPSIEQTPTPQLIRQLTTLLRTVADRLDAEARNTLAERK